MNEQQVRIKHDLHLSGKISFDLIKYKFLLKKQFQFFNILPVVNDTNLFVELNEWELMVSVRWVNSFLQQIDSIRN